MKALAPLVGDSPRTADLLLAALVSLSAGLLLTIGSPFVSARFSLVQQILVFSLAADVFGGIVASHTESTSRWYAERPRWRAVFLAVHVVQPLLILLVGGAGLWFFLWTWLSAVIGAGLVSEFGRRRAVTFAAAWVALSVAFYATWVPQPPGWAWFGYAFPVKLVLGFGLNQVSRD